VAEALTRHHHLVGTEWQGNSVWLPGLKTLLQLLQSAAK
jgi:hypothetical protein